MSICTCAKAETSTSFSKFFSLNSASLLTEFLAAFWAFSSKSLIFFWMSSGNAALQFLLYSTVSSKCCFSSSFFLVSSVSFFIFSSNSAFCLLYFSVNSTIAGILACFAFNSPISAWHSLISATPEFKFLYFIALIAISSQAFAINSELLPPISLTALN